MSPTSSDTLSLTVDIGGPIGCVRLSANAEGILSLDFDAAPDGDISPSGDPSVLKHLRDAEAALRRYAAGKGLAPLPKLAPQGTPFQQQVWQALVSTAPQGRVTSYASLADAAGRPKAARAVGTAMARNPLPIFVPCHRVLASGGTLGGFSGGLGRKEGLLALEGHRVERGRVVSA